MPDECFDVVRRATVSVQGGLVRVLGRSALEAGKPCVDSTPARAHEIDKEREVVHARMPLRE